MNRIPFVGEQSNIQDAIIDGEPLRARRARISFLFRMILDKRRVATLTRALRLDSAGLALQRALFAPFIRAVNYHDVAPAQAAAFEEQLLFFKAHYDVIGAATLESFLDGGKLSGRPGMILTFDDGLRSHAEVVAPLLERHGLVGWFMVPGGFVDEPPLTQRQYAVEHRIPHAAHDYGDPRVALSWPDARRLARSHVVCCHTWSHRRLSASLTPNDLTAEIPLARHRLEAALDREVSAFAWVGGEEDSYSAAAADAIARADFRLSFMTNNQVIQHDTNPLQLQRTNIEASDPMAVVRFQLSGALDVAYRRKRQRVNQLTRAVTT
jgi:peptidoglycan/xylan/chitin deacetylase (PgdA/CDA1 family)